MVSEMTEANVSVLIVDDQPPYRGAARAVIRLTPGFEVVGEAETGEQAVELARDLQPDVVLMDINMPGINGIEAARQILAQRDSTCVILLSTYQADDLPADAVTIGAAAYVHKEDFGPQVVRDIWDARASA
ncbi:MAG: two-component system, NarL family, invasion response regulator UvrY [Actinomycetota bacterium]|jgi:pilus assembly protein CpaE|nr:two-component system, NarL family, invasion response regulator UvrY [Actinomycetota bacterium]